MADAGFIAPYLVVGLQCLRPLAPSIRHSLLGVDRVSIGRADTESHEPDEAARELRVRIVDRWMSTSHARLERDGDAWVLCDAGSKNGTHVAGQRISRVRLRDGDLIEAGSTFAVFRNSVLRQPGEPGTLRSDEHAGPAALCTLSPPLWRRFRQLGRVARSDVPVLVTGATGTGKELIVRAVHELSGRSGPLSPVNCAAIADGLLDSELFGHRKGAFSGADHEHAGLIRTAHGGTLFLDEIAELSEPSQAKLLRALQEREVIPVGDTQRIAVDVRVVAATHQDLASRIGAGSFREDLFGRVSGFRVELPTLRERREDLGVLVAALLRDQGSSDATFTRGAARALYAHEWPRNIRELRHALATAAQLAGGEAIAVQHLPTGTAAAPADARSRLIALLHTHDGNVSAVAKEMATSPGQVRRLAKRHGLSLDDFR